MKYTLSRRHVLQLASGSVAAAALSAPSILRAQAGYPDRPISMVVPFATGGYNDRLSRAFAPYLQAELGQPCIIVNQPVAGRATGLCRLCQPCADGAGGGDRPQGPASGDR